ncbi:MAG: 50S ribosomal protein L6 [Candidatus Zambryskibacteria bacterium]|nr:50S ribosomal protein L6 [Candidatus Zambryskibacteria bacterium]
MSRIGKKVITIPEKTETSYSEGIFAVKGPLGTLTKKFKPEIEITIGQSEINLAPKNMTLENKALWGTYASHITNMISGVNTPYAKKLIIEGIGYKSEVKDNFIKFSLGFSHPVNVSIPEGLKVTVEKNIITISGLDKELVSGFAANIRRLKVPEPYKGKGIRYEGEVVKRKQGKKTA